MEPPRRRADGPEHLPPPGARAAARRSRHGRRGAGTGARGPLGPRALVRPQPLEPRRQTAARPRAGRGRALRGGRH
ncbi:hypothetical protein AM609_08455 [Actinomyces sp. oral taxon 414]|nr:hypothetical protein AM609_08455 [Actinomyces sp. oral taxon 414]